MTSESAFVLVTSSFPFRKDGSEAAGSFVADLADELANYYSVRVVAPGPESIREKWSERVEIVRYAAPTKPLSTLKPWSPRDLLWIVRVLRGGLAATRDAIQPDSPHVLALWGLPCGEWARRATRGKNIGYSVWMLGSDVWSLGRLPIFRGMLARVMREARHAYADGYGLAQDAAHIGKVAVTFLPSTRRIGLAGAPPLRANPPYRLLYLGRWHRNKGVDLLLDALALLGDDDWSSIESFEIQGGGPLEKTVREKIARLRDAGRPVVAGGFLSKPEAELAITCADWIVIPSRVESIPLIFSDAMKLGRPVISTPVGDLATLIALHECGLLAESVEVSAIAEALKQAIQADAFAYTASIKRAAADFSISAVTERLMVDSGRLPK